MSEDQHRGRRRPSREYHSSEAGSSARRPREPSYADEPVSDLFMGHNSVQFSGVKI